MLLLSKSWAFFKRDFQLALTFRYSFLMDFARGMALFVSFFFIGRLFETGGVSAHPLLAGYGGDYFRFVFLGIVLSGLMAGSTNSIGNLIASERGHGTLEAVLLTPTPFAVLVLSKMVWDLGVLLGKLFVYLAVGALIFRIDLSRANWPAAGGVLLLTAGAFFGLGMISAGFNLLLRENAPLEGLFAGASRFLAGVYFPVAVLPTWLQKCSAWVPLTHSLEAARKALVLGAPWGALKTELAVLAGLALALVPAGLFFFRRAFQQARRQGNLGFY